MKPQIDYVSITVAPTYVHYFARYKSGRVKKNYWAGKTFSYFLYSFDFLRESRSVLHIIQQLCVNKILPMSIDNWIYKDHPQCQFSVNPTNSNIICITFASDNYALVKDKIEY